MATQFMQPAGYTVLQNLGINLYSGTGEIIDNSIEAGAKQILIGITREFNGNISYFVIDNAKGMDSDTLEISLTFGGENYGVKKKTVNNVGKYHVGLPLTLLRFSNKSKVFTKKKDTEWFTSTLDIEVLEATGLVDPAKKVNDIPEKIKYIVENISDEKFSLKYDRGTLITCDSLRSELITSTTFNSVIENLKYYIGERYFDVLDSGAVKISLLIDNLDNVTTIESLNPLLTSNEMLKKGEIELLGHFKYENILSVRDIDPSALEDSSIDIEFTIIQKINKNSKMKDIPQVLILNQDNQGLYINRNFKLLERGISVVNKKHNSLNGLRALVKVNGTFDEILGIRLNKSEHDMQDEFLDKLRERINPIVVHLRKMLDRKNPIYENPPTIYVGGRAISPIIIKSRSLQKAGGANSSTSGFTNNGGSPGATDDPKGSTEQDFPNGFEPINKGGNDPEQKHISLKSKMDNLLIFGAEVKPEIEAHNLLNVDIKLIQDDNKYLIYDEYVDKEKGLMLDDLERWWEKKGYITSLNDRLKRSINGREASTQLSFYEMYQEFIRDYTGNKPALLPEVYLNYFTSPNNRKQCVDFVMFLPNNRKIIIEIDGIQHYAERKNDIWRASEKNYALDRSFDRQMTLEGYTIYRFANSELKNLDTKKDEVIKFFTDILKDI